MERKFFWGVLFMFTLASFTVSAMEPPQSTCQTKKGEVSALEQKIKVNASQIDKLNAELTRLKNEDMALKDKLNKARGDAKSACDLFEKCKKDKERFSGIKKEEKSIRDETSAHKKRGDGLRGRVEGTHKSMKGQVETDRRLKCQNLDEGKTPPGDIKKCNDNFNAFNKEKAKIQNFDSESAKLKGDFGKTQGKHKHWEGEFKKLHQPMGINCKGDDVMKEMDGMAKKPWGLDPMQKDLDDINRKIAEMKKMKIDKPKIKKAPPKKKKLGISVSGSAKGKIEIH